MEEFHKWLRTRCHVLGASHGTPNEPLHAIWQNKFMVKFERTWPNLDAFLQELKVWGFVWNSAQALERMERMEKN